MGSQSEAQRVRTKNKQMKYPINIYNITPSLEFYSEVVPLAEESKRYLIRQDWCQGVKNGWLFTNLGKVLCIFLFEVDNTQSPEDNLLWVIVGDLPPMYLDTNSVLDNREVIEVYIQLVIDWIDHLDSGKPLDECFPLEAERSAGSIQMLKERMTLLQYTILPEIEKLPFKLIEKQ
jgi:hypothetical protein